MKKERIIRVIAIMTIIVMLLTTLASCDLSRFAGQDGADGKDGVDGKSAYELAVEKGYQGTLEQWLASLVGEAGAPGKDGTDGKDGADGKDGVDGEDGKDGADGKDGLNGKSAYELAVENGYTGTLTEWLESLIGKDGLNGINGANGADGKDGLNGKSAFELACEAGFEGTLVEWLDSLIGEKGDKGDKGDQGEQGIQGEKGDKGDQGEKGEQGDKGETGATGATGANGKSAYELAVENGYEGTLTEWLVSLAGKDGLNGKDGADGKDGIDGEDGEDGENGKSAFELAVDNGYRGTLQDWLATLVGAKGDKGDKGDDGVGIASILINENGELVITYTDGVVVNVGTVVGADGLKGDKGDQGEQGIQGEKGDKGDQGEQGIQGEQGVQGEKGDKGDQGEQGIQGDKGETGVGIASTTVDANGNIVITYTDGTVTVIEHNWVYSYTLKPATCTETGIDLYSCADCCMARLVTTNAMGHTIVIDEAIEATCTTTGLTEGKHCARCSTVFVYQTTIPVKDHIEVIDAGIEATCTSTGLTEGKHCFVCGTVLIAQQIIDIKHIESDWIIDIEVTKTQNGARHTECTICGNTLKEEIIYSTGSEGLKYTLNKDRVSYSVTGIGTCTDTDIVIPSRYNGLPVTSIGESAFSWKWEIISVTILDGVTKIENDAFVGCISLVSITIPESLTSIADWAFSSCLSLVEICNKSSLNISVGSNDYGAIASCAKNIITDESDSLIDVVGDYIFYVDGATVYLLKYTGTDTEINIPEYEGAEKYVIDAVAFLRKSIDNIEIPDFVTDIGDYAFAGTGIKGITIPDSVDSIGYSVFYFSHTDLHNTVTSIIYEGTIEQWEKISKNSYWDETYQIKEYTIYCTDGEISADGTITYYEKASEGLEFTLNGDGVSYSVTGIGSCKDVDVIIPSEYEGLPVTQIGEDAFSNLIQQYSVNSLIIPNTVTKIGSGAFYNCGIGKLMFTNSVKTVNSGAFSNSGIKEVNFIGNMTDWCGITFGGTDRNPMLNVESFYINGELMTGVVISASVTTLKSYTFVTAPNLTSVVFEQGVKTINSNAFYDCDAITEITISKSITKISSNAFYKCNSLVKINYIGTIDEWNEIVKESKWDYDSGNYTVYCFDGTIAKNGTVIYYED